MPNAKPNKLPSVKQRKKDKPLRVQPDELRALPRAGWYQGVPITVYAPHSDGYLLKASIVADNGGRGMVVPWEEVIFAPLNQQATVEYLERLKGTVE